MPNMADIMCEQPITAVSLSYIRKGKYSPATPTTAVYAMVRVNPLAYDIGADWRAMVILHTPTTHI